jgi:hypothetical protein
VAELQPSNGFILGKPFELRLWPAQETSHFRAWPCCGLCWELGGDLLPIDPRLHHAVVELRCNGQPAVPSSRGEPGDRVRHQRGERGVRRPDDRCFSFTGHEQGRAWGGDLLRTGVGLGTDEAAVGVTRSPRTG